MSSEKKPTLGAVVLAAGLSSRMVRNKMLLPWQGSTVIETVVGTLLQAGVSPVRVVTGRDAGQVANLVEGGKVEACFNPDFANGSMVNSLQVGLKALKGRADAALLALGDQPQMEGDTIFHLIAAWNGDPEHMYLPSWNMRRGHPWLIPEPFWSSILGMGSLDTLREFLKRHEASIRYVLVETPTILADLDTPEDYADGS